jgi:hypothetical protein
MTRIWIAGCAGETLDEIDHERFRQLASDYLFTFVMWVRRMYSVGMPARSEIAARAVVGALQDNPGLRPFWAEVADQASSTTQAAVSSALSD